MISIAGLGVYLPQHQHDAEQIAQASGVPVDVVRHKMGIERKTVPGPQDHTNQMGIWAAQAALRDAGLQGHQIDAVISITEEYKEYPVWTAGIKTAQELGAHRAYAFDVGQKCGSAVLALKLARDMLVADGLQTILIAGGYRNGDLVDYRDPATRFLNNLAAGGGAALVTRQRRGFEILGAAFRTDGSFSYDVIVPVGGTRTRLSAQNLGEYRFQIPDPAGMKARLEAKSLDNFAAVIEEACARSGTTPGRLAYCAMLHMKRSAHEEVLRRCGIPLERSIYLSDYGHLGQIDPLLSLRLARDRGLLKDGDMAILCAAGIGYVWNALCVRYHAA